ncbi:MAG: peptidoglycan DD-metalloendopeptidase family protein [Actinomycetota bacterium]
MYATFPGRRPKWKEQVTTVSKLPIRISLALMLVAGLFSAGRALAVTQADVNAAEAAIRAAHSELQRATSAHADAVARLAEIQDKIDETRTQIDGLQEKIGNLEGQLNERARTAYETGPGITLNVLLAAENFSDFSDRLTFLSSMAESDSTLIVGSEVAEEELQWRRDDLAELNEEQQRTIAELERQQATIESKLKELQERRASLAEQLREQQAAAAAAAVVTGSGGGSTVVSGAGPLQACPVAGGSSFTDSFGDPRSDGRTHQGIDLMASEGTPVAAAQSGSVSHSNSSLGGISAYVRAGNGDLTYYAHMSGYAQSGSVSAGTVIGYVGSTGNASGGAPHLHFEYHPGGGGAVNPYSYLLAVC